MREAEVIMETAVIWYLDQAFKEETHRMNLKLNLAEHISTEETVVDFRHFRDKAQD